MFAGVSGGAVVMVVVGAVRAGGPIVIITGAIDIGVIDIGIIDIGIEGGEISSLASITSFRFATVHDSARARAARRCVRSSPNEIPRGSMA
jgi:hypothetical protein